MSNAIYSKIFILILCMFLYNVYKHVFTCILYKDTYILTRFYTSFLECQKELRFRVVADGLFSVLNL